jgi:hypothetical protein
VGRARERCNDVGSDDWRWLKLLGPTIEHHVQQERVMIWRNVIAVTVNRATYVAKQTRRCTSNHRCIQTRDGHRGSRCDDDWRRFGSGAVVSPRSSLQLLNACRTLDCNLPPRVQQRSRSSVTCISWESRWRSTRLESRLEVIWSHFTPGFVGTLPYRYNFLCSY